MDEVVMLQIIYVIYNHLLYVGVIASLCAIACAYNKIMKLNNVSTTNTLILVMTLALVVFTWFGKVTGEQFIAFLGMVATYKFGRNQAKVEQLG